MARLIDADALMELANNHKNKVVDANDIARFITIEAEPVRHGRCDMCEITEKGHGKIRLYQGSGWQVAIGRGVGGYELVISHFGEHFATKIDYCPYCGLKMDGGAKE